MRKKILGVNVDFDMTMDEVVQKIDALIKERKGSHLVATTSPLFIMSAQQDSEFRTIINNSVLSIPDGVGVLYANYYLNQLSKLKNSVFYKVRAFLLGLKCGYSAYSEKHIFGHQLTGVNLIDRLLSLAEKNNYTVFILGGKKRDSKGNLIEDPQFDMATEAATVIKTRHPNIRIVGSTSAFSKERLEDDNTVSFIQHSMSISNVNNIDILLVAYGPLGQEKWIHRNAKDIPATISVGIGRTLDYITDVMDMPPTIYENMHIAWLYALIKQPWRLKRVFISFPAFPLKVYKEATKKPRI